MKYIKNSAGKTTALLESITNGTNTVSYTYDSFGNIVTISENGEEKVSYTYDGLNQLQRENNKYIDRTIVYGYDAGGNLQYKETSAYTPSKPGMPPQTGDNSNIPWWFRLLLFSSGAVLISVRRTKQNSAEVS